MFRAGEPLVEKIPEQPSNDRQLLENTVDTIQNNIVQAEEVKNNIELTIENEDKNDDQFYSSVESSDDENSIANTDLEMDNQDTDIQGEKPDEDPALPHDLPTNKEPQDSNSNKKKSHSDEFVSEYVSIPSSEGIKITIKQNDVPLALR